MRRALALVAAALLLAACADDPAVVHPFDRVPVPPVPDRTAEVPEGDAPLPDGQYWAVDAEVDGGTVTVTLQQAFFDPVCTSVLGEGNCDGGIGVKAEPSRTVSVDVAGLSPLSVAAPNGQNYALTPSSFTAVVGGDATSVSVPEDYEYSPFPFLASVSGGVITGLQQIWTA